MKLMIVVLLLGSQVTSGTGQSGILNEDEKKDILYMLEEEKLAMDVYQVLGEKWEIEIFANIKASEERHLTSVKRMAEENDITIPATVITLKRGVFDDETLQTLYNDLIQAGNLSVVAALKVGAKIEELDIKDLNRAIANTDSQALIELYSSLKGASENHLRAFVKNLDKQGVMYEPIILSNQDFTNIVNGENVKGSCCTDKKKKAACNGKANKSGGKRNGKIERDVKCN